MQFFQRYSSLGPLIHCSLRRGISFMELTGCLMALTGGVALGLMYLGIDFGTLVEGVAEKTKIAEPGFFSDQVGSAPAETGDRSAKSRDFDDQQPELPSEPTSSLVGNHQPAVDLATDPVQGVNASEPGDPLNSDPLTSTAVSQNRTRECWLALTDCLRAETQSRTASQDGSREWQLFDYLTHRAMSHRQAGEVLRQLSFSAVDPRLVAHAQKYVRWQADGEELYGRSVNLLTDMSGSQLSGPLAQSWQSAATQHQMEEKLLQDKNAALAAYLDHTYPAVAPFVSAFDR